MIFGRGSRRSIRYSIFLGVLTGSVFSGTGAFAVDPIPLNQSNFYEEISSNLLGDFILETNIDILTDVPEPTRYYGIFDDFQGNLDGNNLEIKNIDNPLFSSLSNASVSNLILIGNLEEVHTGGMAPAGNRGLLAGSAVNSIITDLVLQGSVSGGYEVGGLVGAAIESTIAHITSSVEVSGWGKVGGIVGISTESDFSNVTISSSVEGLSSNIGGLVGSASTSSISASSFTGTVSSSSQAVGGLVGYLDRSSISTSSTDVLINSENGGTGASGTGVGGLVGRADDATISQSFSTGLICGTGGTTHSCVDPVSGSNVGGLVGYFGHGDLSYTNTGISDSNSSVAVNAGNSAGGLVGELAGSKIVNSFATGNVISNGVNVGGLVGRAICKDFVSYVSDCGPDELDSDKWETNNTFINSSFATGNVSGVANVGGLVGYTLGDITNSYAMGDVVASQHTAGGLIGHAEWIEDVGHNFLPGLISNSYSTGNVEGVLYEVGGLVGYSIFSIRNSYSTGNVSGGDPLNNFYNGRYPEAENSFAAGLVCPKVELTSDTCDITDPDVLETETYKLNPLSEFPVNPVDILNTEGSLGAGHWNVSCLNGGNPYLVSLLSSYKGSCTTAGGNRTRRERAEREVAEARTSEKIEKSLGFKTEASLPKNAQLTFVDATTKIDIAKVKAVEIAPTANVQVTAKAGEALQISLKSESKEPVELWVKSPDGSWLLAGVITFDKDGKAILPALQFKNVGDYTLVLNKLSADSAKGSAPLNQTGSLLVAVS